MVRRGRGRPKKVKDVVMEAVEMEAAMVRVERRGRGRPKKIKDG